jgi:hypothetical protein
MVESGGQPGPSRCAIVGAGRPDTWRTIIAKQDAVEKLDLDDAVQALWYLDPPQFN